MRIIIKKLFVRFDEGTPIINVENTLSLDDYYHLSEEEINNDYKNDILELLQFEPSMEYQLLVSFQMVSEFSLSLGGTNGSDSFRSIDETIYTDKIDLLDVHAMPSLADLDI